MELTREVAIDILSRDSNLQMAENQGLRALRDRHCKRPRIDFSDIS
jgi:hypothetical protein